MVITDYFNLKPVRLWPDMASFPYQSIRLLAPYDDGADLSVDIFIRFMNKGNLLELTQWIYLEVDEIPVRTKENTDSLCEQILERVKRQHETIEAMSKKEVIEKYIESRYYAFRRWRQYFQEDWRPPKEVLDRIKECGIIEITAEKGSTWKELKKAFDPRTDYVPGKE